MCLGLDACSNYIVRRPTQRMTNVSQAAASWVWNVEMMAVVALVGHVHRRPG